MSTVPITGAMQHGGTHHTLIYRSLENTRKTEKTERRESAPYPELPDAIAEALNFLPDRNAVDVGIDRQFVVEQYRSHRRKSKERRYVYKKSYTFFYVSYLKHYSRGPQS